MEFIDLKSQYKSLRPLILERIERVLEQGSYIMGPEIDELESALCAYTGRKYCISCANGTDALLMALMALNIGPGDAVFTTTFTFIATAEVISLLGATPVFVDIDPKTFNIDPVKLNEAIYSVKKNNHPKLKSNLHPKAIIPVDLFGLPCDYDALDKIALEHNLHIIEDAAQSFGGSHNGKKCCSFGDISCTSFFPAKPLGCYGDGGALFTDNSSLAEILKSIRVHGKGTDKYDNIRIGLNGRLDTIQAAILLVKLSVFDQELEAKTKLASRYTDALSGFVSTPFIPQEYKSAWAQYSLLSKNRNKIMSQLKNSGIPSMVYYPKPLHEQKAFSYLGYESSDFPVATQVAQEIFSLPMHAYLSESDFEKITNPDHYS